MAFDEKQYTLDRLNEMETMLYELNEVVVDFRDRVVKHREPEAVTHESDEETDLRENLSDDTPVGHGWVTDEDGWELFKPESNGHFTRWLGASRKWGPLGYWEEAELPTLHPAMVSDLRLMDVPVTEWPDITAPKPEPSHAEAIAERDNAIAALRAIRDRMELGVCLTDPNGDTQKGYRESLTIVAAGLRLHGIDLDEGVS